MSRDPIGERGGINVLAFSSNASINRIDVLGAFSTAIRPVLLEKITDWVCDQTVSRSATQVIAISIPGIMSGEIGVSHRLNLLWAGRRQEDCVNRFKPIELTHGVDPDRRWPPWDINVGFYGMASAGPQAYARIEYTYQTFARRWYSWGSQTRLTVRSSVTAYRWIDFCCKCLQITYDIDGETRGHINHGGQAALAGVTALVFSFRWEILPVLAGEILRGVQSGGLLPAF